LRPDSGECSQDATAKSEREFQEVIENRGVKKGRLKSGGEEEE
jgi:hypothetical protein